MVYVHSWGSIRIIHSPDIGANLTDGMYQGVYHGSKKHEPDLDKVLRRAWDNGMDNMIITGGSLNDSKNAIDLAQSDCKFFEILTTYLLWFGLHLPIVYTILNRKKGRYIAYFIDLFWQRYKCAYKIIIWIYF